MEVDDKCSLTFEIVAGRSPVTASRVACLGVGSAGITACAHGICGSRRTPTQHVSLFCFV